MSYHGTVTCSNCWEQGHNRAGCPGLKERMQKRLEEDPDDWRAKQYFEKKARSKKRTCSYCANVGHNRKTCKELSYAKAVTREKAAEWRVKALEYLSHIGLGVGALVTYENWSKEAQPTMVAEIDWNKLDHRYDYSDWHETNSFALGHLGRSDFRRSDHNVALPKDETNKVTRAGYSPYRPIAIIGGLSAESVKSQIPANWLSGESAVTEIFDKDTKPHSVSDWVQFQNFYKEK